MREFDYYIFIDYSENLIGYLIIDKCKLKELLPKISKFAHYRYLRHKSAYVHSIKRVIEREKVLDFFAKHKINEMRQNMGIYLDVLDFIKKHHNCIIFVSVDDHEFSNFKKLVRISDGERVEVVKESQLREWDMEYRISLVLDTLLNLERLDRNKK